MQSKDLHTTRVSGSPKDKASTRTTPSPRGMQSILWLGLWLGCVALLVSACDANFQIEDERGRIERVGATSFCDVGRRVSKGAQGEHSLRVFLADDRRSPPGTIAPGLLGKPPLTMSPKSYAIAEGQWAPTLLSLEDGRKIQGAAVTMSVVTRPETFSLQPDPRYEAFVERAGNKRIPRAISALIDMSDAAKAHDNGGTRLSSMALWALENFNSDTSLGDLDVLSILLMRSGVVSRNDLLFIGPEWEDDIQYIAEDGRRRGYIMTTSQAKEDIARSLTNIGPSQTDGTLPLYRAIQAASADLGLVATDRTTDVSVFLPMLLTVTVGMDQDLGKKAGREQLDAAKQRLRPSQRTNDAIPLMSVVYPKPSDITIDRWQEHLNQLCELTQSSGANNTGQLFRLRPSRAIATRQDITREALDMAYHAAAGYTQLAVAYDIKGAAPGRYLVAFKLKASLLGDTSDPEKSPLITFEVEIAP